MKLLFVWCLVLMSVIRSKQQEGEFYGPQTFRNQIESHLQNQQQLFRPQRQEQPSWQVQERADGENRLDWRPDPWRQVTKEQTANILHHKQALTSDGNFRYEFSADNGVAAGEVIAPDGTRTGAYQYKDPNGQLVKLKYRAGKEGFQILEGSHLPKSPEPVSYPYQGTHFQEAFEQQRRQYDLQQQHNEGSSRPAVQKMWTRTPTPAQLYQGYERPRPVQQEQQQRGAGNQYFVQNWPTSSQGGPEDDGQYRENDVDDQRQGQSNLEENQGPHNFGEGYSFSFNG